MAETVPQNIDKAGFSKRTLLVVIVSAVVLMVVSYSVYIYLLVPRGDIVIGGDTELDEKNYAYAEEFVPELITELEDNGMKVEKYTMEIESIERTYRGYCGYSFYAVVRLKDKEKAVDFLDYREDIYLNREELSDGSRWEDYRRLYRHMGYLSSWQLEPDGLFIEYFGVLPNNVS